MKILNVNKFFYKKGGSETYFFSLKDLLNKNGHEVIDFSMNDEKNIDSLYSKYFIDNIDYNSAHGIMTKVKLAAKIIYSSEAKNKIMELASKEHPDIAHLHIFQHQMSGSIVKALKRLNIPVVYTAHDLKCVCANYRMLSKDKVCEKCKGGKHLNCLLNKCVKDSYSKSLINFLEMNVNGFLGVYDSIDYIVTPSKFYMDKLIEHGIPGRKLVHIPNFINADRYEPSYENENYFIYLGRLSKEKGVHTLINAMESVENTKLYIIGTGPVEDEIKEYIKNKNLENRIKLLGYKSGRELESLVRNSMFNVIPSEWYENGPYSLLETMAYGKPSIGSNLGGIPEMIEDGKTGFIFKSGDHEELAQKIKALIGDKALIKEFGMRARKKLVEEYNEEGHYKKLIKVYDRILKK